MYRLCSSRENVLRNLADKAFDRPICEALLDQRFFNGIGNYLRAEILYRSVGRCGHQGWGGRCVSTLSPAEDSLLSPALLQAANTPF